MFRASQDLRPAPGGRLRRTASAALSAGLHASALSWLVWTPTPGLPPQTIYQQLIAPHRERIVWYNLREKLPDVAPREVAGNPLPPRTRRRAPQTLISDSPERRKAAQMIFLPEAPETDREIPSPNVVAIREKIPPRTFVPPPPRPIPATPAPLPDAPQIAATSLTPSPLTPDVARPKPRDFVPPPTRPAPTTPTTLPDAPQIASAALGPSPFEPYTARPRARDFTPPARSAPPPSQLPAPATDNPAGRPETVIVGLHPALTTEVPDPTAALRAGFSAAPEPRRRNTGDGAESGAKLNVPGLIVRGGPRDNTPTLIARVLEAPTSAANLSAAVRGAPRATTSDEPTTRKAVRVSSAPDPRLEGRIVYTIAVQMPNITSYSGSWIFWFAERQRQPDAPLDMRPPSPVRKVDPKYFAAAVDERIEGKVRLAAVIRATGRVDTVSLVSGFDARLDRSAAEALAKWEFEPALRNGAPVDVDAVIEIPFRVAPRPSK